MRVRRQNGFGQEKAETADVSPKAERLRTGGSKTPLVSPNHERDLEEAKKALEHKGKG